MTTQAHGLGAPHGARCTCSICKPRLGSFADLWPHFTPEQIELIGRKVNAHDELVAALRRIADYDVPDAHEMLRIARAALAKCAP